LPRALAHMAKQGKAKDTPPSPAATAGAREAEAVDAEPTLRKLATVLNNIQTQLGGYGARLEAIEQAGAEDVVEADAEDGVAEGGEPPAPAPQCARRGCRRSAYPNHEGGFYPHCGRTCHSQDQEAGTDPRDDDTRSDAGRSDTGSWYSMLMLSTVSVVARGSVLW
jgi:hypothetical protein